jgi:hypothetical protein
MIPNGTCSAASPFSGQSSASPQVRLQFFDHLDRRGLLPCRILEEEQRRRCLAVNTLRLKERIEILRHVADLGRPSLSPEGRPAPSRAKPSLRRS